GYSSERTAIVGGDEKPIREGGKNFDRAAARMNGNVPASARALQAPGPAAVSRHVKSIGGRGVEDCPLFRIDDEVVEANADERQRRQHFPRCPAVRGSVNAGAQSRVKIAFSGPRIGLLRISRVERD